jgi:hypothetical protein
MYIIYIKIYYSVLRYARRHDRTLTCCEKIWTRYILYILWCTMTRSLSSLLFSLFPLIALAQERPRKVFAWASSENTAQQISQLRNESWIRVIDGVQAFCGIAFGQEDGRFLVNAEAWSHCEDLRQACQETGTEFHVVIGDRVPNEFNSVDAFLEDAIQFAVDNDIQGYSLDDEYDCSPRSTVKMFQEWMEWINKFGDGLHAAGLPLTIAVQAMSGIQDVPYQPHCGPNKTAADCSQSCHLIPEAYPYEPRVTELMASSAVDVWLAMDTYYYTTGRFLGCLEWYAKYVPTRNLGIGMSNRDDLTMDGLQARFHAIDKSGVEWINHFLLPIDDQFLPFMTRWKTRCKGCGLQSVLGCYDFDIECNDVTVGLDGLLGQA